MNATALELCLENLTLSDNKQKLMELSRKKNLIMTATITAKKRSRSKLFGTGSMGYASSSKKMQMSEDLRTKKVEELTTDIASLEDRMRQLQKQRVRDEQLKQYMGASAIEEIAKLRRDKRKYEEEVLLIQKKQEKAKWYKDRKSTNSSSSDGSSSSGSNEAIVFFLGNVM